MESLYEPESTPVDVVGFVWKRKATMLLTFLAVFAISLAYLSLAARTYRSEAKLFVLMGRESVTLDPTATTGQFMAVADTRESEVHAVEELLTSRGLADKIVDQFSPAVILERSANKRSLSLSQRLSWLDAYNLNPLRIYSLRDKAVKAFRKNLSVTTGKKSSILTVSYESEDPRLARDALAALLQAVRDEHLQVHRTKGSQEFFEKQAELLRASLAQREEQLRDLKDETGFAALPKQRELQLELVGSLRADLVRAQAEQEAARAEVERRRQQLRDQPALIVTAQTTGQPQTARQTLREKLYELEIKEQDLASKLKDEAPQLMHIRAQIAEARRIMTEEQVATQVTKSINQTHQSGEMALQEREAQLVALTARTQSLQDTIAAVEKTMKKLNASEVQIGQMEREIELARANYRKYAENLEQARIDQELEQAKISSLNVMQPPTFSETPVSPEPIATLGLGLGAAVLSSIGVALLADRRRSPRSASTVVTTPVVREASGAPLVPTRPRRSEAVPANPR